MGYVRSRAWVGAGDSASGGLLVGCRLGWCRGGEPLVGRFPGLEPSGGEGRGAFGRRAGTGLDGREGDTFAGDERELRGTPGLVPGNDLLIVPVHHVIGPTVH